MISHIIDRERVENELQFRVELENLITTLSTKFINLELEEVDDGINNTLQAIGAFSGVDRSYVFLLTAVGFAINTHEWCDDGIEPQIDNLQNVTKKESPWFARQLKKMSPIFIPRISDLPTEAIEEKKLFEGQGIQSLLVVPIISDNTLIGYLGFDSVKKEAGWNEETISLLKIVGEMFSHALKRKRVETALNYRVKIETLVTKISANFLNIGMDKINDGIMDALNSIGEFTGVDRSYIFRLEHESSFNTHEWCRVGITHQKKALQNILHESTPWFWYQMRNFHMVHIPSLDDLPDDARVEKLLFQKQDIKSLLVVPMFSRKKLIGYLGLDSVVHEKMWTPEDITLLQLVAEILVNALERERTDLQIKKRTKELEDANMEVQNTLEHLKQIQSQLVQSEKMSSLGVLVAGVAHEINNPTTFSHIGAQNLDRKLNLFKDFLLDLIEGESDKLKPMFQQKFDELFSELKAILEGTRRIKGIVTNLRTFGRPEDEEPKRINIVEGLKSTIQLAQANYYKYNIEVSENLPEQLEILCWPAQLNQVFMNLLINSCDAIQTHPLAKERKGKVEISLQRKEKFVEIRFEDNGCGIPQEIQSRIFEPFYTTKSVGKGTGLGLSISHGIVEKHQGEIALDSKENEGTTITILLPTQFQFKRSIPQEK